MGLHHHCIFAHQRSLRKFSPFNRANKIGLMCCSKASISTINKIFHCNGCLVYHNLVWLSYWCWAMPLSQELFLAKETGYTNTLGMNSVSPHQHSTGTGVEMMRGLVDCWTISTTSIMLYYPVCVPPGRGDFLCVLLPISPTQCRIGI